MTKENNVILTARDIVVEFDVRDKVLTAIRGVSLDLIEGEVLALVGESGSGKSVTALSLIGLLDDNAHVTGSIKLGDEELIGKTDEEMSKLRGTRISMIFQDPLSALTPMFTIGDQIAEALLTHNPSMNKADVRKRCIELLTIVGITDPENRLDSFPHEFSGGMRQRIVIAIALACRPDILICDEPTTALDVTIQAQILRLIKKLRDETNTAVIFISHDMGVIYQMVDRVVVMYAGQFVESAPCKKLFENPLHPYTIGLQNAIPQINKQQSSLQDIPGSVPMLDNLPEGCLFAPRCPFAKAECFTKKVPLKQYDDHDVRCLLVDEGGWHNE